MASCCDVPLLPSPLDDTTATSNAFTDDNGGDNEVATPLRLPTFTPPSFIQTAIAFVKSPPFTTTVTTVAVFVILANSLTLGLESLWSDVGNCWEVIFELIESVVGPNTFVLFVGVSSLLHVAIYWIVTIPLTILDASANATTVHPLSTYKMQPFKNVPLDMDKLTRCIYQVLFNQYVISLPVIVIAYPLAMMRGCGMTLPLPTFTVFVRDILMMLVIEEVIFYYSHRLLHHPAVYGLVHKRHHEWTSPIAVAAIYAHPIEHVISNLLPVLIGPLLLGSHVAVWWVWESMALLMAINTHSGYHLPFLPSPESHDYHHQKFNVNYGVLGVLDWIHGTDAMFKQSPVYPLHRTFFSLEGYTPGAVRVNQVLAAAQNNMTVPTDKSGALFKTTTDVTDFKTDISEFDNADCSQIKLTAVIAATAPLNNTSTPSSSSSTLLESDMTL